MRSRGSVAGPLILIAIGILFFVHTLVPEFQVGEVLAHDWPYFLIIWGVVQLVEIFIRAGRGAAIPGNGISAGGWAIALFICFVGLVSWEARRPDTWWGHAGFERSIQMFGEPHDYSFEQIRKKVGTNPHIVIESFRGDAKISGSDSTDLTLTGHKSVRALNGSDADHANSQTPVELIVQGNTLIVRCNQDRAGRQQQVTTYLDLIVPRGATIQAAGRYGDFEISSISGDVDISSDNAGIRLQDVAGNVKLDTRRSDEVRCSNVKGTVTVRGRGGDVDLSKIDGGVNINGTYSGTISLHQIGRPIRVESMRTQVDAQSVPGELTLARGSLNVENVVGPLRVETRSTDITLKNFSDAVELAVDKGDVELRPGKLPISRMVVHTHSGNIELALPQKATFALSATTGHGDIENEFGDGLKQESQGNGARLEGTVGNGPQLNLGTDRGSITVRKATAEDSNSTTAKDKGVETQTADTLNL